jgi:hypothetical protein
LSASISKSLRSNQEIKGKEPLEQLLLNALTSGDPIEISPDMIEQLRKKLHARAAQRKPASR